MMSTVNKTKTNGVVPVVSLSSIQRELQLYHQECRLYQRLLRSMDSTSLQVEILHDHLCKVSREKLPKLQQALRSFDGENANATSAEDGRSHMSYFLDQLYSVRSQIMALKYEVFDQLRQHPVKPHIW
jgi:redox-regulated HSP33 family molecular chaperone